MKSPDIADGVAALVGWAVDGIGRAGTALVVREGGVRFQGMANREIRNQLSKGERSILLPCCPLNAGSYLLLVFNSC